MIKYDLAIVGGGLAGFALSIQISRAGYKVILFEKEQYPFHRVCGEYISLESWDFLKGLGIDLDAWSLPQIKRVQVSDVKGRSFEQPLPLGGFGISRYKLDSTLAMIAKQAGVEIKEQTRVNDIIRLTGSPDSYRVGQEFSNEEFEIYTSAGDFKASVVAGCYGKRSNLDVKWKRPFIIARKNKLNNYIGVKYHVHHSFPEDLIALHNFNKGYCGISKVEDDQYCLCYMTTADNLQNSDNDIDRMEQTILSANPYLKKILSECTKTHEPVIISQISFDKKSSVEDHVLMIGDTAGMIAPLCGNGMSMALHGSKIAAEQIQRFLSGTISREQMEQGYSSNWNKLFASRLQMGRRLQRLFDSQRLTSFMIGLGRRFPFITRALIRKTHGKPF